MVTHFSRALYEDLNADMRLLCAIRSASRLYGTEQPRCKPYLHSGLIQKRQLRALRKADVVIDLQYCNHDLRCCKKTWCSGTETSFSMHQGEMMKAVASCSPLYASFRRF